MMQVFLVTIYLIAIVIANLSVATFGPDVVIMNSFLLIGLDLTCRDRLHELWHNRGLVWKMGALIAAGSVISYLLNASAGRIALASLVAFALAAVVDTVVFSWLRGSKWLVRSNASNVASAAVDSILFPVLAFGAFLPWIILGQFIAKVAGGFIWSVVLGATRQAKLRWMASRAASGGVVSS
jgi:uncharacterized PurR-regulated membrane protein YhhQ (DUF165 family)